MYQALSIYGAHDANAYKISSSHYNGEKMDYSGTFIAIEGIDGSGLSTQAEQLRAALTSRGISAYRTKEPTDGPVGGILRLALTGRIEIPPETFALLFAADRMDHLASDVCPKLNVGMNVICDRYFFSNYAYQGMDLGLDWLKEINVHALVPDITIFLDVDPEICLKRMASRMRIEFFETREKLVRTRKNFLEILDAYKKDTGANIVTVDGTAPIGDVTESILSEVAPLLKSRT